jgi:sortase A
MSDPERPASPDSRRRAWLLAERTALGFGILCLIIWATVHVDRFAGRRRAIDQFTALQAATMTSPSAPDVSLWSPVRIAAWQKTVKDPGPAPLAILRIPRIHLEVPVLEGTDEVELNRGAGHIGDTPPPGAEGNSGIAAHRDGFFRGLKDVGPGDAIELETLSVTEVFRVERTWIVDPEDVSVLDPTPTPSLTLVTCYPFYYVGSAPRRYIVRASLTGQGARR